VEVEAELGHPSGFHPFRWEDSEDPFEALHELRLKCPISQVEFPPLPPAKLVTRYDDLGTIFRDWRTFHNIGVSIDVDGWKAIPPEQHGIISSNPPHHGPKRRIMLNAVAPAPVDQAAPAIRAFAEKVVERFAKSNGAEMVAEWAKPIPSAAIAIVLGLPVEDCVRHGHWTTQIILSSSQMSPSHPDFGKVPSASAYMPGDGSSPFTYLQEHLDRRRDGEIQADDGIKAMLEARHPQTGASYSDAEILEAVNTMLAAGNETTTSLMANLLWRLAIRPDLYSALRRDRSLILAAIDESLRLDPPQQIFERVCIRDTEVGGVPFSDGEPVILSLASGNRDGSVYGDDADEFRLDRELPNPPNWSMGGGIHLCVGAYLARTTAEIGLNALLDRIETVSLAPGFEYRKVEFHHFRGPRRLDLILQSSPK
jgi:cytochrome P450